MRFYAVAYGAHSIVIGRYIVQADRSARTLVAEQTGPRVVRITVIDEDDEIQEV